MGCGVLFLVIIIFTWSLHLEVVLSHKHLQSSIKGVYDADEIILKVKCINWVSCWILLFPPFLKILLIMRVIKDMVIKYSCKNVLYKWHKQLQKNLCFIKIWMSLVREKLTGFYWLHQIRIFQVFWHFPVIHGNMYLPIL